MQSVTKIVGILNITPDSFSDGGAYEDNNAIIKALQKLIYDGADVIDIGAESTRPGATILTPEEEWARLNSVLPQICMVAKEAGILTSIDTRHALTAKQAIDCGIDWVNDVSGAGGEQMQNVLANWHGRVVIMHNLGVPADKNITFPENINPVEEVGSWLSARLELLEKKGIARDRVIIDPGIGFGKTAVQSWSLINNINELRSLGVEILVGHSRKSFLNGFQSNSHLAAGNGVLESDASTLKVSLRLAASGVDYLRVHNVALHKASLKHLI